jgi:hypothetical protein
VLACSLARSALFSSPAPSWPLLAKITTKVVFESGLGCKDERTQPGHLVRRPDEGAVVPVNSGSFFVRGTAAGSDWVTRVLHEPFGAAARRAPANIIQENLAVMFWASREGASGSWYSPGTLNSELRNWEPGHRVLHIFGWDKLLNKYEMLTKLSHACGFPGTSKRDRPPLPECMAAVRNSTSIVERVAQNMLAVNRFGCERSE